MTVNVTDTRIVTVLVSEFKFSINYPLKFLEQSETWKCEASFKQA